MARQPHFWHIAGCVLDTAARTRSAVAAGTLIQTQRALEPTLSATFGDVAEVTDSLTVDLPKLEGSFALAPARHTHQKPRAGPTLRLRRQRARLSWHTYANAKKTLL